MNVELVVRIVLPGTLRVKRVLTALLILNLRSLRHMYCVARLVLLVSALGAAHAQLSGKLLCPKPLAETLLTSIIGGLFLEGRIPPGNVINAGANEGAYACWYAQVAPERLVHAIDPDLGHIENMRDRLGAALPATSHHGGSDLASGCVVVGKDLHGVAGVNGGVSFVRRSQQALELLAAWWTWPDRGADGVLDARLKFKVDFPMEQAALNGNAQVCVHQLIHHTP